MNFFHRQLTTGLVFILLMSISFPVYALTPQLTVIEKTNQQTTVHSSTSNESHTHDLSLSDLPSFEEFLKRIQEDLLSDCSLIIPGIYKLYQPLCESILLSTGDQLKTEECLAQAEEMAKTKVNLCEDSKRSSQNLLKLSKTQLKNLYFETLKKLSDK